MKEAIHPKYVETTITCACGNVITFEEDTLEAGSIVCDRCGENLEFEFDEDFEDAE